jgi:hypothetical protein
MKEDQMGWIYSTQRRERKLTQYLVRKYGGKKYCITCGRRWEANIKLDVKELGKVEVN